MNGRKLYSCNGKWKNVSNQTGFTLIESLLVLFCVAVLVTISLMFGRVFSEKAIFDNAVQKFIATVYEAQTLAGELNEYTTVEVNQHGQVIINAEGIEGISKWQIPENMSIKINTTNNVIQFTKSRTISRLGSVEFISPNYHETYTINMGFGRLRKQ